MGFYPFNPTLGQKMQTNGAVEVDAAYVAHLSIAAVDAAAAVATAVHASFATSTLLTTVTTAITNPGYPKNITATAGGVDADVKAVQVIITGTDFNDEVITESLPAFTVNTLGTVVGAKAFKTVTKIEVPGMDGAGVTITIGTGVLLGIPYKLSHNTVLKAYHTGTLEGTAPTVAISATVLASNTFTTNTALDGNDVDLFLMV